MIVDRCRYRQPVAPIILLIGGQVSQEQFHPLILSFGDAVCLGMKRRGYVLFYTEALTQGLGEMRRKLGISVRNDSGW